MIIFQSLISMWLLSLTVDSVVTLGQDHTSLSSLTEKTSNWQSIEHEEYTLKATSAVENIQKPSVSAATVDETMSESATIPQQRPQFAGSTMSTDATASLNNSALTLPNESPENTSAPTEPQTSDTSLAVTWMTSPNQNRSTEKNAESIGNNQTTSPSESTEFLSTSLTPSKPVQDGSTRTHLSVKPTGDLHSTLPLNTRKMPIQTIWPKKGKDSQGDNSKRRESHATVVASVMGGALAAMIIGFIAIFVWKQKHKQQQVVTKDWAGPSPFLENNTSNGHMNFTSSSRISVSSFLPQTLSRKLSLLPEEDQELEDIIMGTTFGGTQEVSCLASEHVKNSLQESNETVAAMPEVKSEGNGTGSSSHVN